MYAAAHFPYQGPFVTSEPLSETETLKPNYIAWLVGGRLSAIHGAAEPDTLLFRVLRVAVLQAFADTALALANRPSDDIPPRYREPELVDMADFRDPDFSGQAERAEHLYCVALPEERTVSWRASRPTALASFLLAYPSKNLFAMNSARMLP